MGAISSGLCMIHCLATPFFFFAATCSSTCCSTTPLWWQWLDYAFLFISFFAVNRSTKNSNSDIVKYGLWLSWIFLFISILNVKFAFITIAENIKFIPAFSLIGFHLYNIRYCQCTQEECC